MFPVVIIRRLLGASRQLGGRRRSKIRISVISIDGRGPLRRSYLVSNSGLRELYKGWNARFYDTAPTTVPPRSPLDTPIPWFHILAQLSLMISTIIPPSLGITPLSLAATRIPPPYRMRRCRCCIFLQSSVRWSQEGILACSSVRRRLSVWFFKSAKFAGSLFHNFSFKWALILAKLGTKLLKTFQSARNDFISVMVGDSLRPLTASVVFQRLIVCPGELYVLSNQHYLWRMIIYSASTKRPRPLKD